MRTLVSCLDRSLAGHIDRQAGHVQVAQHSLYVRLGDVSKPTAEAQIAQMDTAALAVHVQAEASAAAAQEAAVQYMRVACVLTELVPMDVLLPSPAAASADEDTDDMPTVSGVLVPRQVCLCLDCLSSCVAETS